MCAATALSRALTAEGVDNVKPEQVQHAITGSEAPAPWLPPQFVAAVRLWPIVLTIYRQGGHATQTIGAGSLDDTLACKRIFLQLNKEGTHVEMARGIPPDALHFSRMAGQYVDVGKGGTEWTTSRLRILLNVRAESGAVATPGVERAAWQPRVAGASRARGSARGTSSLPPGRVRAGAPRGGTRQPHAQRASGSVAGCAAADAPDATFGSCSGVVPAGVTDIKTLMAALPCNLPGHVDGWMRKQAFHLQRILAAEPRPEDGFATDEARWRYEMAVLGPKMEYELLRHRAGAGGGAKWAQGLGATLPAIRAQLPPLEPVAWRAWDGSALLVTLREAVDARVMQPAHARALPTGEGICELLERGRIPAAKAALYGDVVSPHPAPSEAMRDELQTKNPRPEAMASDVVPEDEWQRVAADCAERCDRLRADHRVSADDLLAAARTQRGGAAAGPDGWSGAYLRRLATLFPTEIAELMWREFRVLSDTYDPLLVCSVTDATIGGIAKPHGGFRPIAIGRCAARCLVAHLVKRVRPALRVLLERGHQYALTGVLPAVVRPFTMAAKCAAAGVPWAITDDDFSNAFNAVSQRALFEATQRIATVAPELAACMLRAQCMIRGEGSAEMVMRGRYPPNHPAPFVVERYARGGGQGCPDMPAAFAEVISLINLEAEAEMCDVGWDMSVEDACAVLWPLVRAQAGRPPSEAAPDAWREALTRLMAAPRPDARWGGPRGEASSAYADDTHSGGWVVASIIKSLRRVAKARVLASLAADPLKCKVLTSASLKPDVDVLLAPLRCGNAGGWEVVTRMRVLGVTLSDPTDRAQLEEAIRGTLGVRVVAPTERLLAELAAGAKPATAYFALTRFVLPNALYHMQVWGLLCQEGVWAEVDDALSRFCAALCPLDQRGHLAASPAARAELALPQRFGGLGIPRVALEARVRAAEQWDYRDAAEAGMLRLNAAAAYRRPDAGALDANRWVPLGMDAHFTAVADSLSGGLPPAERVALARRRERNQLRSALWAFAAVPWVPELTIDHTEWDVMWRLTFGGMSAEMRHRLDHPADGFAFRGRRMEYAVMEAVRECVPSGIMATSPQPAPELIPPDHAARCARDGTSPDGWKRADIALAFITGKTITLDVRTTNTQCASAGSAPVHLRGLEREKTAKYRDYYRDFHPFVIDLSGAVSERSFGVLKLITKEAAKAAGPRLTWERFDWAVRIQRRVAVAMVRTTAWLATREPARVVIPGCLAGLSRPPAIG